MDNALALIRRAFVVYSVYGRAHDHAAEWTGLPVSIQVSDGRFGRDRGMKVVLRRRRARSELAAGIPGRAAYPCAIPAG
jgi:hypothetical protein